MASTPKELGWKTSSLLLPAKQLCFSPNVDDRMRGYTLIVSICRENSPPAPIEIRCLWSALNNHLIERESRALDLQLSATKHLLKAASGLPEQVQVINQVISFTFNDSVPGFHDIGRWKSSIRYGELLLGLLDPLNYTFTEAQSRNLFSSLDRTVQNSLRKIRVGAISPKELVSIGAVTTRFLRFLDNGLRHRIISSSCVSTLVQALCQLLEFYGQDELKTEVQCQHSRPIYFELIKLATSMLQDDLYRESTFSTLEDILLPSVNSFDPDLAKGALTLIGHYVWDTIWPKRGNSSPPASETPLEVTLDVEWLLDLLTKVPLKWMNRTGSNDILEVLCRLVWKICHHGGYELSSTLAVFSGKVVTEMGRVLQEFRYPNGERHTMNILESKTAPRGVLEVLESIFCLPMEKTTTNPRLDTIMIGLGTHFDDGSLSSLITSMERRHCFDPSSADWSIHLGTLLSFYRHNMSGYSKSRRSIASCVASLYDHLAELEDCSHLEIVKDVIESWELTLPEEEDQEILESAFHVMSEEIILSHDSEGSYSERIRTLWTKLAMKEQSSCFKRVLAIKFLIITFNRLAFPSRRSFKTVLSKTDQQLSAAALATAISLFQDLLALVEMTEHHEGRLVARLNCPPARIAILQWLLRLRSGARHRIHSVDGELTEVIPLAKFAGRYTGQDTTQGANGEQRQEHLSRRRDSTFSLKSSISSVSRSSPELPEDHLTRKGPFWMLPEVLDPRIFEGTLFPTTSMSSYASFKGEKRGKWLPISSYLATIIEILQSDPDWDIVSFVLCHLPLQLANQHLFCGPRVDPIICRLVVAICDAIDGDSLYKRVTKERDIGVGQNDVNAILYSALAVLFSYKERFAAYSNNPGSMSLQHRIVDTFVAGVGTGLTTSRPCLEALSLLIYAMPEALKRRSADIVEKLSRTMTIRGMAVHVLELLILLGYNRKLYIGSFRKDDYQRVFGAALIYIEEHYREQKATYRTNDGRELFSLAQHLLNASYLVIHIWFMRIRVEDRPSYIPFITDRLIAANRGKTPLRATTKVCLDWLARYTYGNADPKVTPSMLYRTVVCPQVPEGWQFSVRQPWREKDEKEQENVANCKAWKLGSSIITVATLKSGWIRMVCRRPSCLVELICRLEGERSLKAAANLVQFATRETNEPTNGTDKAIKQILATAIEEQNHRDVDLPDAITGLSWNSFVDLPPRDTPDPAIITPFLTSYPYDEARKLRRFPDVKKLWPKLELIDSAPVIDTHNVGVVYIAPGQQTEAEILRNSHGSPSYDQFIEKLGRVIKPNDNLEVYTGGLQSAKHGNYALAWWDDIGQILFHVATFMPYVDEGRWKKAEIGNDPVKIIWNDGGRPVPFGLMPSQFNLVNIIIEPHTKLPRAVYEGGWPWHANSSFKVLLQTDPRLPHITPVGDFKIVASEHLPRLIRHYSLLASLYCHAYVNTGMDEDFVYPLNTNWQQRLRYIDQTESLLDPKVDINEYKHGLPTTDV